MRAARRPNVVLFVSDQQRADTMPGVRPPALPVRTPHLDWLAARGTLFRRAYCTTPLCAPARASLLSGLYPHRTGMVANYHLEGGAPTLALPAGVTLLGDYLTPLGYASAYVGKWHVGTGSDRRGFTAFTTRSGVHDVVRPEDNDFVRFCRQAGLDVDPSYSRQFDPHTYDRRTRRGAAALPLAFHLSMLDALRAAGFVYRMEGDRRPLLLVYSCFEPHRPLAVPRPYAASVPAAGIPLPETRRDPDGPALLRRRPDSQLETSDRFSDDDLRAMWASYLGGVSYVDHLIGTIVSALIDTGRFDDTLFVFTSDHGELLGSHGLLWKGSMLYEELVRVPLLVCPPRRNRLVESDARLESDDRDAHDVPDRPPARQTSHLVSHVDLVPTILRWCGASLPDGLHGTDIRPLVEGRDAPLRDGLALEYHSHVWGRVPTPLRGWVTPDWKYVEGHDGGEELYHLARDPLEGHNLIDDQDARPAQQTMYRSLRAALERAGDPWPHVPMPPAS